MSAAFTTAPEGGQFSYVAGVTTYEPTGTKYTTIGVAITFTATVSLADGLIPVEYRWDFGDGSLGYGTPVDHTYKVSYPDCQAVLRVTDSNGQYHYVRRQIYLTV